MLALFNKYFITLCFNFRDGSVLSSILSYCFSSFLFNHLVMATLQLPATNLANLANLPPGTKLYLTTNSKNPSGKGKLLLIPQGAILRATNNASESLILLFGSWLSWYVHLTYQRSSFYLFQEAFPWLWWCNGSICPNALKTCII